MSRWLLYSSLSLLSLFSMAFALMPHGIISPKIVPFVALITLDVSSIQKDDPSALPYPKYCGSTIIKRDVLLTAAHCMIVPPEKMSVQAGTKDQFILGKGETRKVVRYLKHENYDSSVDPTRDDIALVWLKKDFLSLYIIEPIALPIKTDYFAYMKAKAYGWGLDEFGEPVAVIRKANFHILPDTDENCEKLPKSKRLCGIGVVDESKIPKFEQATACHGDTGGPLALKRRIIGIISKVDSECRVDRPVIFTRVLDYVDWIRANAGL